MPAGVPGAVSSALRPGRRPAGRRFSHVVRFPHPHRHSVVDSGTATSSSARDHRSAPTGRDHPRPRPAARARPQGSPPCFLPAPLDADHARQGHALAGRGHPGHRRHLSNPLAGPRARAAAPLPDIVEKDELATRVRGVVKSSAAAAALGRVRTRVFIESSARMRRAARKGAELREAYGDRRLIRFLRQHKSEKKGVKAVKEYLRWREAEKIDLIRDQIMAGKDRPETWPSGAFFKARCAVL